MSALTMDTQNTETRNSGATKGNIVPESPSSSPSSSSSFENGATNRENNEISGFYHRGHNAESVAEYIYKIRDDTVRPREFLGTDSSDGIEAILTDRHGHSLHEYIKGDDPLRPFIDFDLCRETFDKIEPKLTRKEVRYTLYKAF